MANVIGSMPEPISGSYGEYLFAKALVENFSDDIDIAFNLNLVGANEMDVVMSHPNFGNFIIEVKGNTVTQIKDRSGSGFVLQPTPTAPGRIVIDPIGQVRNQLFSFIQYFSARGYRPPYLYVCVAFPQISRLDWEQKFGILDGEENFFFKDDLVDLHSIESKLEMNMKFPLQGKARSAKLSNKSDTLDNLKLAMQRKLKAPAVRVFEKSDLLEIQTGQDKVLDDVIQRETKLLRITGQAGTGKTYRLLQWANLQAAQSKRVLVTTFNNSLTAELRRINSKNLAFDHGSVSILSFSELLNQVAERLQINPFDGNNRMEEIVWESVYSRLTNTNQSLHDNELYDAIAIDEAQDVYDHIWKFIQTSVIKPSTVWAMALAKGQNLYIPNHEVHNLEIMRWIRSLNDKDVFEDDLPSPKRTISKGFIVAQAFRDANPPWETKELETASRLDQYKLIKELNQITGSEQVRSAVLKSDIKWITRHGRSGTFLLSDAIEILAEKMADLGEDAAEAILFTHNKDSRIKNVLQILEQKNIAYANLLEDGDFDNKLPVSPQRIRISTIHKVRGIDCTNAIIFGLDDLDFDDVPDASVFSQTALNLWYVAMSRAKLDTFIVAEIDDYATEYSQSPDLYHDECVAGLPGRNVFDPFLQAVKRFKFH